MTAAEARVDHLHSVNAHAALVLVHRGLQLALASLPFGQRVSKVARIAQRGIRSRVSRRRHDVDRVADERDRVARRASQRGGVDSADAEDRCLGRVHELENSAQGRAPVLRHLQGKLRRVVGGKREQLLVLQLKQRGGTDHDPVHVVRDVVQTEADRRIGKRTGSRKSTRRLSSSMTVITLRACSGTAAFKASVMGVLP